MKPVFFKKLESFNNLSNAIQFENVYVAYSGSGRPALRDVSISIGLDRLILVTGPNGAGKTTFLETCLGLLKPVKGCVRLMGVDTRSRSIIRVRRMCSYLPQDFMRPPYESYTAKRVIAMGLASMKGCFEPLTRSENDYILEIARMLGIVDLLNKPIGKLSGGQQQRVFIARALVRRPLIALLDEPFSSIDKESRKSIAEILRRYVDRFNSLVVIVSHDVNPVENYANGVLEFKDGILINVRGDLGV